MRRLCGLDFLFSTHGGLHRDGENRGRVTDMGRTVEPAPSLPDRGRRVRGTVSSFHAMTGPK